MTRILAADPGYGAFGWALVEFSGQSRIILDGGEWTTTKDDGDDIARVGMMASRFRWRIQDLKPDAIGVEAFGFQRGQQNTKVLRGMTRLIERIRVYAEEFSVPVFEIDTSAAKSAIGLHGKVPKERVRKTVEAMFGTRVAEHMADAVAVAVATHSRARLEKAKGAA